jgi:hypothetical protein
VTENGASVAPAASAESSKRLRRFERLVFVILSLFPKRQEYHAEVALASLVCELSRDLHGANSLILEATVQMTISHGNYPFSSPRPCL